MNAEEFSMRSNSTQTNNDLYYAENISDYFQHSPGKTLDKLRNFPKFIPRQDLAKFLAKNEIFQKLINVHGDIVECGVYFGSGLFSWAQFSAIYEPYNHNRHIIGFDSFSGFPNITDEDKSECNNEQLNIGGLNANVAFSDLVEGIKLFDINRPLGHLSKVELVKGDATKTIPEFINMNKHIVVSLLYLDFDLFEPTKIALENFIPRMPIGAIIVFDELIQKQWPGETLAVLDILGLNNLRIQRFPYVPQLSYCVIE